MVRGREVARVRNNTVKKNFFFFSQNVDELSGFLGPECKVKTTVVAYLACSGCEVQCRHLK